ncbi:LPXTG cell wall anchor domain-containing protein [Streptomyces sp. SS]|uniref:LPXTG cell wall anchor domain-containing protein n=1 Tax=Streptomyces sp. SS TaxID=260742 RepID=UPI00031407C8|nr:LPXTG cell wall anchor domain-containing protein [Streptomyces sp. SS]
MKIRRILATAVAAAVTTPALFLSAAPAFADTKPAAPQSQKPSSHEDDIDDEMPSIEELKAAVAVAQKAYDEAVAEHDKAEAAFKALDKPDNPLVAKAADAKKAVEAAAAAKATADEELAKAVQAEKDVLAKPDATEQQKTDAAAAVTAAKKTAADAAAAKATADEELTKAVTARDDARIAAARLAELARKVKVAAKEDLDEAKEELKFAEEIEGECKVDDAVDVTLSGPKTVTAGQPAVFSLRVTNTSDRALDVVDAFATAVRLPKPDEVIDDETVLEGRLIPIEWSSADVLEWTPITDKYESIEVGRLAKGASYDVKLRLTVAADAPAGRGVAFAYAEYENKDGSCGLGEDYPDVEFGILAAKGDKPKPTPSPSTTTPTPAPSTGGNHNTTQQGGSSNTPVKGSLAATGANDTLPLGIAAAGAVALGAGALVVTRRRKAGADA